MPPRNPPRSPFAGIGAGHAIVANMPRQPSSPTRSRFNSSASPTKADSAIPEQSTSTYALDPSLVPYTASHFSGSSVSDSITRAYYVDVVLGQASSSSHSGVPFSFSSANLAKPSDAAAFTAWLGELVYDHDADPLAGSSLPDEHSSVPKSASGSSINAVSSSSPAPPAASTAPSSAKPSKVDSARLFARVQELIDTERSYVNRIDVLHQKYAIPLRTLAKDRDTAIIPLYEAQRLFGNIGEIAGANRAFLNDLERLASQGQDSLRAGLGDVLYNHMSCFSCYTEYFANFEKAKHIEQTLAKHRAFCDFADRTKYSVTGIGNTGIRDLLMEPIQRIPRYKLLIDAILTHVDARDPLRSRLHQAITLVSRIASCEADEKTQRAAILWSFSRNVESFPAELISAHRRFIDCIDVDDFPLDPSAASSGIIAPFSGLKPIHCSLFLFDDRIAVVKRSSASTCGRKRIGLDDIGKLTSQMKTFTERSSHAPLLAQSKRPELAFRGSISLADIDAQDLGGSDLQLAFLRTPSHVTGDKWVSRPLRQYVAVDASSATPSTLASRAQMGSSTLDADVAAKLEKMRFLDSVWRAKALYKARQSRCETRCRIVPASRRTMSDDAMVGPPRPVADPSDVRKVIYFHLHSTATFEHGHSRSPLALSLDAPTALGTSESALPHAILDIIEVDEMEEDFVGQVRTKGADLTQVSGEPYRLASADLGDHAVQLSDEVEKRYGSLVQALAQSQPGTPSGSGFRHRAKAAAGLENFGRSLLFGSSGANSSISSAGISNLDVFGSPTRRSNSNASKSTFSSNAASVSSRGMTHSTAGTSISSRSGAFEALSRGNADSPRSFRRFGRRRSSSVGPPSSVASRCDADSAEEDDAHLQRRTWAATPDPVSLLAGSSLASPRKLGGANAAGGRAIGAHARARTESAAATSNWSPSKAQPPYQQRQRAESVELSRTPSSASRKPTGPREQTSPSPAPRPHSRIEPPSPSWLSSGPTTPLNIRRKPPPRMGSATDDENDAELATPVRARPASSIGVYAADRASSTAAGDTSVAKRRVSGTKRPLSSSGYDSLAAHADESLTKRPSLGRDHDDLDAKQGPALLPRSAPLARLSAEEPSAQRPSISESETSTERGHGADGAKPIAEASASGKAPVTPARTSSTASKSQEARRRNEAVEHGLRLVKEEMNLLRCDVEILQSSLSATDGDARTPRKRRGDDAVLAELDVNAAASISAEVDHIHARLKKLAFLLSDVDAKWISAIRMHNRIMHDLTTATSALAAAQASEATRSATSSGPDEAVLKEKQQLEIQLAALKRKCELLTTLEADGRLENTEIHKAFNEELDMLYSHTQAPENDELTTLRNELKRTKHDQHELMLSNKRLKRDLAIQQSQAETYRLALLKHGLL
ncbi:hypothetical protein PANT_25c00006 [Moesziomyces antarcticus T-34]|uniref:DH domain-containing protein n=1 Tax=Pseudozyma antarctica (strain T-34) TaxID=1151754 RepID=M9M0S1_PSEA3|nr:hypothetical protein PANT_25c00006 [Moesziomyces antarcticus T-34]